MPKKKYVERWTLRLIADKVVELGYVDSLSHMTVKHMLKYQLKPYQKKCWGIPPEQNASFVAAMEDVLRVHGVIKRMAFCRRMRV